MIVNRNWLVQRWRFSASDDEERSGWWEWIQLIVMRRVHYRDSSVSTVRPATQGLRRSADRLRRVLVVSVITTTLVIVIETRRFVRVLTTLLVDSVACVCRRSTATHALVDQVITVTTRLSAWPALRPSLPSSADSLQSAWPQLTIVLLN